MPINRATTEGWRLGEAILPEKLLQNKVDSKFLGTGGREGSRSLYTCIHRRIFWKDAQRTISSSSLQGGRQDVVKITFHCAPSGSV